MKTSRPEHPRPQLVRDSWLNLNGEWTYEFDFGKSGLDRNFNESDGFTGSIRVPFCPESELSGVGHKDFIEMMWYQRSFEIPEEWSGMHVFLRFGAVDYECEAFIDGTTVGRHWGGTSSFAFDITGSVSAGSAHNLVVCVRDELRSGVQAGGKQCPDFESRGCHYTRTTGIWQTVWLEAIAPGGLTEVHIVPDVDNSRFLFTPRFAGIIEDAQFTVSLTADGRAVSKSTVTAADGSTIPIDIGTSELWSPGSPFLYDVEFTVRKGGDIVDEVASYSGMRKVHTQGNRVYLNNEPYYQRLVLDQGFYPDGIWTAPSDEALRHDIELSMSAGFNGARLHQKVFEERFHYWADKLGYLTWGESSSWGIDYIDPIAARNYLSEWREIVVRDRNHPSIVAWSPFNESSRNAGEPQHKRLHLDAYELTKAVDPTRPVNDSSGYCHYVTDLYTVHNYEQDPEKLSGILTPTAEGDPFRNMPDHDSAYANQPYIIDEFGGIKWDPATQDELTPGDRKTSWGYGTAPKSIDEFYERLERMVRVIRSLSHIHGFCYTQLTDVEQEQNGIYFYDRSSKFDMSRISTIFNLE